MLYVGNDVNDLPCFALVGWPVAVASAHDVVRGAARAVTTVPGGDGVIRSIASWISALLSTPSTSKELLHHEHQLPSASVRFEDRAGYRSTSSARSASTTTASSRTPSKLIDAAAEAGSRGQVPEAHPGDLHPARPVGHRARHPLGRMTYIDYRHRVEFGDVETAKIHEYAKSKNIDWFASPRNTQAVAFLEKFDVPAHKVASAPPHRRRAAARPARHRPHGHPLHGHVDPEQIRHAVEVLGSDNILLCHATSTYPAKAEELNLRVINTLQAEYPNVPIGYSGHETGLQTTLAAVARAPPSSSATSPSTARCGSTRPPPSSRGPHPPRPRHPHHRGLPLGDGVKKVYESELGPMKKLRRVTGVVAEAEIAAAAGEPVTV